MGGSYGRTGSILFPAPAPIAPSQPTEAEIDGLIARARTHPLGTEFLRDGALDAVAVTFGVHAFLVDAARDQLQGEAASDAVEILTRVIPPAIG